MTLFHLDERFERDGFFIGALDLCQVRLMNDRRWPWLILVPQRDGICEVFDLSPSDQASAWTETAKVAKALKAITGTDKINIGALGNIVRQMHIHVIARREGDANWPGPVWGYGTPERWEEADRSSFSARILERLNA